MTLQRMARDRFAFAIRCSSVRELDGAAFGVGGGGMARVLRGVAERAGRSVGYGVWQKAQTLRLLLSLPHFGQSIGIKIHSRRDTGNTHYHRDAREGSKVTPPAAASHGPLAVKPAGTEIAGLAMNVTYQHERIQSMYVGIAVPATDTGYGVATSKGSTWVTGRTKYSYFSKNAWACTCRCAWRAAASVA